jgi:capsular exopolysaccharide synthesis family protein
VSLKAPPAFAAEQYQGLQLTLERIARARDTKVIAITSPGTGDGKTLTSVKLAAALARTNARVLVIDADLRRPSVMTRLGLGEARATGLANPVGDTTLKLQNVIHAVPGTNLWVMPAGELTTPVHTVLSSPRLKQVLAEAREQFDYVVLDTPPLLPVFDSALLAGAVDGILLIVSANKTPRKLLGEALNMLEAGKVLGIVFNRDERPLFGYYDRNYRQYFTDAPYTPAREA